MKSCVLLLVLAVSSVSEASDSIALESIEVSGNKEGRTLSETPESITILPPSRINRGDQQNSLEVLNGQANIQVSKNAEVFSIRGINNTGTTGFQKDNLASIFVDDVFQTDLALRAGAFEVWDLDTLEIYRGPQSTSQGVNSLAGAILLNHAQPHSERETALKLGYGSYNRRELGALANTSLLNRKLAVRLSFNKDMNDGFIENKTTRNKKWGSQDKGHLAADFKYSFDDKSELRFNNKFMKTDNGGQYTIGGNSFDYTVREDQDFRSVTNNIQNSVHYIKPWSDRLSTKSVLAFTKGIQNNRSDADATPDPIGGRRREYANDQFLSFENVLKYNSDKIKNALGVHVHQFRSFNNYDFNIMFTPTVPVHVVQDLDKTRETYAIFDSLLYKLTPNHSLNLGLRYEMVKNEYGTFVNPLTTTGNPTTDAYLNSVRGSYDGKEDTSVVLPKVGYIYEKNRHTLGVTYSQGYRIGGVDINRSQAKAVSYDPEYTDNYEGSWKYVSKNFQTQANIFYTRWRDQQVEVRLSQTDTYNSQVENAANSELYGGELESVYTWESGDTLRLGVGHVQTQFLSFNNNGKTYTGNEFPDAAKWTAQTAWGHQYSDKVSSNVTVRHVSKSFTNAENDRGAPEQLYLDLNIQYAGSNYIWELNGRNLLGQEYVINSSPVYQETYKRTNRPREFNTRITWFW